MIDIKENYNEYEEENKWTTKIKTQQNRKSNKETSLNLHEAIIMTFYRNNKSFK
jgi:hypothetical protein